jgi:undecaprenyl diphosphate synthase
MLIKDAVALTSRNTGLQLTIAFNYGARDEIVRAARSIARQVAEGVLDVESITADVMAKHFDTAELPDPDLLIRTSGEQRISNFLLWQCAYAEFFLVDTLWPDFTKQMLAHAIDAYRLRERRFGGISTS